LISGDCDFSKKNTYNLYKKIMGKNLFLTETIEIAEAAKVFENTQRDVNISLMNEFQKYIVIFDFLTFLGFSN
jgi:UDP-N-acetyl-D-mannosaminuronate dehydrogenase